MEIQVASVLMHAWSEVEHDLIYKPLEGDLSSQERAILDQLNGLVIAGELSLEMLQKAGEVRVASNSREFLNHYELAAHLLSHANGLLGKPVEDSGLGRVDRLFDLISLLKIKTPAQLASYLESLHDNLEERPLAEQVIDAILAEDYSRYDTFNSVLRESQESAEIGGRSQGADRHELIGRALTSWVNLEEELRRLASESGLDVARAPVISWLNQISTLEDDTRRD
ncbi:hypothetical protein NKH18_12950 [Streptomyces sp. M10(2022)]